MPKIKQFVSTLMKDIPNPNMENYATIDSLVKKYISTVPPVREHHKTLYNRDLLQIWENTIKEGNLITCENGKILDLTDVHKRKDIEKLNSYSSKFIVDLQKKIENKGVKSVEKQLIQNYLAEISTSLANNKEQYLVLEKYSLGINEYEMYLCSGISTRNYVISIICSYNPPYTTRKYLNTELLYKMYVFICYAYGAENYSVTNADLDVSYVDFSTEKLTHNLKNPHSKEMTSCPNKSITMTMLLEKYCKEQGITSKEMSPQEVALFSELISMVKSNIKAHVVFD